MRWPVLLLCLPQIAGAQYLGEIRGVVKDAAGLVVRGASITVVSNETGMRRATHSNGAGEYAFGSLDAGEYKITARQEGFRTTVLTRLSVQPAESVQVDFILQVGSVHEVVTVEANAGDEQEIRTNAVIATVVARDAVERLPIQGRNIMSVFDLAPGVVLTPATAGEAGQFTANGQRANANYITVDGVSANTGVAGGGSPGNFAGSALPGMTAIGSMHNIATLGEVDDIVIRTSSFTPEFARMPGAQISIATRSGSDRFHGSAAAEYRPRSLAATDAIANRAGIPATPSRLADTAVTFGGPLIRNRTFFFASADALSLDDSYVFRAPVPSLASRESAPALYRRLVDAYPLPNGPTLADGAAELDAAARHPAHVHSENLRLDQWAGAHSTVFARYAHSYSASDAGFFDIEKDRLRWDSLTSGVTTAAGATATNDVRFNFTRAAITSSWTGTDLSGFFPPVSGAPTSGIVYGLSIAGLPQLVSGNNGSASQNQVDASDAFTFSRSGHQARIGGEYIHLTPTRDRAVATEIGTFGDLPSLLGGQPIAINTAPPVARSSRIQTLSLYGQDTWHIGPRATLSYGIAWDLTPPPAPKLWPARYNQFAPRAGIVFRLNDAGTLVARAGAGMFYDLGFSSSTDAINGLPFNRFVASPVAGTAAPQTGIVYSFAPNLRLPRAVEWNVTLEGLFQRGTASLAYIGSSGGDLLRREGYLTGAGPLPSQIVATNHASSSYNALQLQYRRRLAARVNAIASYTWSHSIDTSSWDSSLMLVLPGAGAAQDRGASNFDVRHNATAGVELTLPFALEANAMFRARTGFPIDVVTAENAFGLSFDNAFRPDLTGAPIWLDDRSAPGGRILNRAAFAAPLFGRQGDLGRNAIRGFGFSQLDLALARTFPLSRAVRLEVRLDSYNILNRASFADPIRFLSSALFGTSASMLDLMMGSGTPHSGLAPGLQLGGPRVVQAGLRLAF